MSTSAAPIMRTKDEQLKAVLRDMDSSQFRLSCAVRALEAVHDAMREGLFDPKHYLDGLFAVCELLSDTSNEFRARIDAGYVEMRGEGDFV